MSLVLERIGRISRSGWMVAAVLAAMTGCDQAGRDAQIDVVTHPGGAVVFCNDREIGTAPVTVTRLGPGTHMIVATRDGHRTARRSVSLVQGQRTAVEMRLEPVQGLVHVVSRPEGARVFIGGAFRGETPLFMTDVPVGEHRIAFEARGYLSQEVSVRVADRTPRRIDVDLIPDAGRLEVRSDPSGATVRLNGVDRGQTPLTIADAPSGENLVEVLLAGFKPYAERIVLRAQEAREIAATLEAVPTRLQVVSLPPGARVYVENQYRGETPLELTDLRPGEHRVRAELRGFEPSARTIRLAEEGQTVEEFRLVKNSGKLVVVSEPAGATVFLNGEEAGRTVASAHSDLLSDPLEIDLLPPGEYRVQLSRQGFMHRPVAVRIEVNEVTEIHERMVRRFVADTRVRLRESDIVREGMLLREFPNGDIELQLETGTIMRIQAEDIASREALRLRD